MKLKNKKGFTLVECVVAMAVLAIMSLLLMMILNVTVMTRNSNMKTERELDEQVDKIVQAPSEADAIAQEIKFVQNVGGVPTDIESIPKDGDENIDAKKVYDDGNEAELDALKYDFSNYEKFDKISKGGGSDPGAPDEDPDKVYGSADTSTVQIYQQSVSDNLKPDGTLDGTKTLKLRVSFNASSFSVESGLKVTLPKTAVSVKVTDSSNCLALFITDNVLRVEPTGTGSVYADVSFVITDDVFDNEYKSVKNFYEGSGTGSPAQLSKNALGKFEP